MKHARKAIFGMFLVFFVIGFMSAFNDVLMPDFKSAFNLTYSQMALVSFSFFIAYGVMSFPCGQITQAVGFRWGLVIGLLLDVLGCFLMLIALESQHFYMLLCAIFIIATGVVMMLVTAMPYASLLGEPKTSSSRLTFVEVFHSLGSTVAPILGGWMVFHSVSGFIDLNSQNALSVNIQHMYMGMIVILFIMLAIIISLPMPKFHLNTPERFVAKLMTNKALLACLAIIFVYTGAEVSIGGFMITDIINDRDLGINAAQASNYVGIYWFLFLIGRFVGSYILRLIRTEALVAACALIALVMVVASLFLHGEAMVLLLVAVGLFNAIQFPSLYAIGLGAVKESKAVGSGLLAIGITGAAIVPLIQGEVADHFSLQVSYIVPAVCYVLIFGYAVTLYCRHRNVS